jgi:predicted transposase YdaD
MLDRRAEFQYIDLLMETDSFFYQLLKQLPETLFALLGEPLTRVADYRFDGLEVKKSYRLDGLFLPARADLPVYFVEVQKGIEKGRALEKRQLVERLQANGQTLKEIAHLLGTSVAEVRRLVGR